MNSDYQKDTIFCKKMTREYGTSYFISTYFFPKILRERTWVLYAFVRYPDEIVDNQEKDAGIAREKVLEWKMEWQKAYNGSTEVHPVLRANAVLWKECNIPFEYPTFVTSPIWIVSGNFSFVNLIASGFISLA